jgi:hypothetical protein
LGRALAIRARDLGDTAYPTYVSIFSYLTTHVHLPLTRLLAAAAANRKLDVSCIVRGCRPAKQRKMATSTASQDISITITPSSHCALKFMSGTRLVTRMYREVMLAPCVRMRHIIGGQRRLARHTVNIAPSSQAKLMTSRDTKTREVIHKFTLRASARSRVFLRSVACRPFGPWCRRSP